MFLLIPLALLFLCFAYLSLNEVGLYTEIFVYILMSCIVFFTYLLYNKIQKNLKQQEINTIKKEIFELENKARDEKDGIKKENYLKKISKLQREITEQIYNS